MKPIAIPQRYNYIAVFLTLACNLKCSYCINHFQKPAVRRALLSGEEWVRGLNRLDCRPDIPVTLQGGEPSLHPDFIHIINHLKTALNIDILTNLQFDVRDFIRQVPAGRLKREAPYASLRVSFHPETMDFEGLTEKILFMLDSGFSIGIWAVRHPVYEKTILEAKAKCENMGIDFRLKEFLGEHRNTLHGRYSYAGACDRKSARSVRCRTTELLLDSSGSVFRCHSDLYSGVGAIGHILDADFDIEDKFRACGNFGFCNPCDVKTKTNRFQQFGHTSVEVRF